MHARLKIFLWAFLIVFGFFCFLVMLGWNGKFEGFGAVTGLANLQRRLPVVLLYSFAGATFYSIVKARE
jgi:hypothetical protein